MIKANKLTVLEFIKQRRIVQAFELCEKFGYSLNYAHVRLQRLKRQGLVINMTPGFWELTEEGFRRLRYHGKTKN